MLWTTREIQCTLLKKRGLLIIPVLIHSFSTFGALAVWLLPPWMLFSSQYDEIGLLER